MALSTHCRHNAQDHETEMSAVPVCYREWRWLGRAFFTVNCIFKSSSLLISAFLNFDLFFFTSELLGRWRNSLYVCWLLVDWDLVIVVCVCFICYILIAYSWIWRLFMHVVRAPDKKYPAMLKCKWRKNACAHTSLDALKPHIHIPWYERLSTHTWGIWV